MVRALLNCSRWWKGEVPFSRCTSSATNEKREIFDCGSEEKLLSVDTVREKGLLYILFSHAHALFHYVQKPLLCSSPRPPACQVFQSALQQWMDLQDLPRHPIILWTRTTVSVSPLWPDIHCHSDVLNPTSSSSCSLPKRSSTVPSLLPSALPPIFSSVPLPQITRQHCCSLHTRLLTFNCSAPFNQSGKKPSTFFMSTLCNFFIPLYHSFFL